MITQKNLNYNKEWESVKDVKMYYDIVKAANHNQIGTRDGISLSLSQALEQIETLYSYTYGTYSIATDSSYSFTDTVEMNFSALPITTNDFVSLTNQTLAICHNQYNRITYSGDKYFYSVKFTVINSTSSNVLVSVTSIFSAKHRPLNDFTPIGEWPKTVFSNNFTNTYYNDYKTCEVPNQDNDYNGEQAPYWLAAKMNEYKGYLNYDPFYYIAQGQPDPNVNGVLAGVQEYKGSAKRYRFVNGNDVEQYDFHNYWDTILHQRNPNDPTQNDCNKEYNCFKIATLTGSENSYHCANNTRSKCLNLEECNHYFDRLMTCALQTMNHYGKYHFISAAPQVSGSICVNNICSYWMGFNITLGNLYTVPTKVEDKLVFPNPI